MYNKVRWNLEKGNERVMAEKESCERLSRNGVTLEKRDILNEDGRVEKTLKILKYKSNQLGIRLLAEVDCLVNYFDWRIEYIE